LVFVVGRQLFGVDVLCDYLLANRRAKDVVYCRHPKFHGMLGRWQVIEVYFGANVINTRKEAAGYILVVIWLVRFLGVAVLYPKVLPLCWQKASVRRYGSSEGPQSHFPS